MSFLTERKLANTLDVPVNLPATEIKMADWVVIGTFKLVAPSRLTYRMLHLNFIDSTIDLTKIKAQNYINPGFGIVYVALFYNYTSGDPGGLAKLDRVGAYNFGVVTRTGSPFISAVEGTYTWIAVNNIQYSTENALLTVEDSADFRLSCTGQCRIELDLTQ